MSVTTASAIPIARVMRRSSVHWLNYAFLAPYLIFFCAFVLFPLVYGFVVSFYDFELVTNRPPEFVGLRNYSEALHDPLFWNGLWAALRFVVLTVPLRVGFALFLALAISRVGRHESFFRAAFFVPTIMSVAVVSLVWKWFYDADFGLLNHYLGYLGVHICWLTRVEWAMKSIAGMSIWWHFGSAMVILLAGLKQISPSLYEAAQVDGAGPVQTFFNITLPALRPVLLFVTVVSIIGSFQVFGQTFMMTGGGPQHSTLVIVHYIYRQSFEYYRMGYGAALSYLLFAVIAIVTVVKFRLAREKS